MHFVALQISDEKRASKLLETYEIVPLTVKIGYRILTNAVMKTVLFMWISGEKLKD